MKHTTKYFVISLLIAAYVGILNAQLPPVPPLPSSLPGTLPTAIVDPVMPDFTGQTDVLDDQEYVLEPADDVIVEEVIQDPTPAPAAPVAPQMVAGVPLMPPTPPPPSFTSLPAMPTKLPSTPSPQISADPFPSIPLHTASKSQAAAAQDKNIYLNFENAELSSFIDYLAELKKINVIQDKAVTGSKISLTIRQPLTLDGAWNIFLTVLEMAGFSIINVDDLYRIVPKDKKIKQPLPAFINIPYTQLPNSDIMIRYVLPLLNIQVEDVRQLLESMLSTPSSVIAQRETNAFIITDKSYNIKSAIKIIQELDQMGLPEEVTVLKLKSINALDAKDLLDALIRKPDSNNPLARLLGKTSEGTAEYFSPTTRIVPDERNNALIFLGNSKSIDKLVKFVRENLDKELKSAHSPLKIVELQHTDAAAMAELLKSAMQPPDSSTGQAASKYGAIRGGVKYFKPMTFQVDRDGNRLIVNCTDKQDWKLLKKTIQDLDKPQPQVALETMIVTINSSDLKKLQGVVRNKKHGQIGTNIDFQSPGPKGSPSLETVGSQPISLLGNLIDQIVFSKGASILTFGKTENIWGVIEAIKQTTNSSISSQPFVTVANKTKANITVGETRRVIQEQGSGITGYTSDSANTVIDVTPQINLDGIIRMDISTTIKDFGSSDNVKFEKMVNTSVSVADGQVLVLGGFVKTKVDESKAGTPLLQDIPILGWLFKNQSREITKEYLFVFIAPTIVKPRQLPGMNLYTKLKMHQATNDIEDAIQTKRTLDPVHNWFFNYDKEQYSHKVIDFANARYQPNAVDIKQDIFYRAATGTESEADLDKKQETKEPEKVAATVAWSSRAPEPEQPAPSQPNIPTMPTLEPMPPSPAPALIAPPAPLPPSTPPSALSVQPTPAPQQPVPSAPVAAALTPASLEQELEQRRQSLREKISTLPQPAVPAPQQQLATPPSPAQRLNDLLSVPTRTTGQDTTIDQRNRLKDFLSNNPALVQRNPSEHRAFGRAA